MRNPWVHRRDDDTSASESGSGTRNAVRLGVALWLLVGVAAVGLYLGWSAAPRQYDDSHSVDGPGFVVESEGSSLTLLVPVGGRGYGVTVDVAPPRMEVVVADSSFVVVAPPSAGT